MLVVSVDKELKLGGGSGDCHPMTVSAPLGGVGAQGW